MSITYTIAIDYNDDGDFSDMGEDISSDVFAITWRLGMTKPFDSIAAPATAQITVRNTGGDYSPEDGGDSLLPGKRIRIQSDDGVTVRTHFSGLISRIEPMPGEQGKRYAIIHAHDHMNALAQNLMRLPPQVDATADEVIDAVLDACELRRAVLDGYCVIGVSGYNSIGTAKLFGQNIARSLETGKSTFAYVGDTWEDSTRAIDAIRHAAESERGRFFFNREGQPVFYNRHHTLVDTSSMATFDDDMDGLAYTYGAEVVNRVQITVTPRSIGVAETVLWEMENPQYFVTGVTTLIVRFRDDVDNPVGALELLPPVREIDYTANTEADGSGADATGQVDVTLSESGFSAVSLEVRNDNDGGVYLQAGMQLRGTPLYTGDPATLEQSNAESATFYGPGILALDLPALTSIGEADQMARYELARRKDPRGTIYSIQTSTRTFPMHVLARTLFDRITVLEAQTGHNADYFIVAEQHSVELGGARHCVSWLLEPADSDVYVIIGLSKPDGEHVLAY